MRRKQIKLGHELAVMNEFVKWWNSRASKKLKVISMPDPPDAILQYGNAYIWIEHADVYRSPDEAHEEYAYVTAEEPQFTHREHPIYEPDEKTAIAFVNTLDNKLSKESYSKFNEKYSQGILILTERDPLFSTSTLTAICTKIRGLKLSSDRCYFREAYIGYRTTKGLDFLKVYPMR
jgi:hypothetical protein